MANNSHDGYERSMEGVKAYLEDTRDTLLEIQEPSSPAFGGEREDGRIAGKLEMIDQALRYFFPSSEPVHEKVKFTDEGGLGAMPSGGGWWF